MSGFLVIIVIFRRSLSGTVEYPVNIEPLKKGKRENKSKANNSCTEKELHLICQEIEFLFF